jgi:hypothetical protein
MKENPWLTNIVEFAPLKPGCTIGVRGEQSKVYEVRRLVSRSTPIAGKPRTLWVALHAGFGSVTVFVCLERGQREWRVP